MASTILPAVEFFGGQTSQAAWVKTILSFGCIGPVFLYLNAFFVKERVDNQAPPANFLKSLKVAFQNKYWLMSAGLQVCCTVTLLFNLSISVYYLKNVVGNLGLMGAFVACSNLPGVVIAQVIFILGPKSIPVLLESALIRGIGFGFPMGLVNAMTGDTIEYGEWKTGTKCQAILFSCKAVAEKHCSGLMTSLFGFYLTAFGYDGALPVQSEGTVGAIDAFFRFGPVIVAIGILLLCGFWHLDKEMPQIRKDLAERRGGRISCDL